MKTKNSRTRWIIDAILFCGSILCFFFDLTGPRFHQLLGVFVIDHLAVHWDWVAIVASRFARQIPVRSRTNFKKERHPGGDRSFG